MASNRLQLNPAKTELIWLASSRRLHWCPSDALLVSGVWIQPSKKVRNLGVIIDLDLSLASHISHVTSLCYFHIRQLRLVQRSLKQDMAETLVRSFIHSCLDYCNGVLAGQPAYVYKQLQSVLRSAQDLSWKFQVMQAWWLECATNCIGLGFRIESPSSYAPSPTSVYMARLLTTSLDHAFWFQWYVVDHGWGQRQFDNCWPHPSILKHLAVEASRSPVQRHGMLFQTTWSRCNISQFSLSRNTWKHTFSKFHKQCIHIPGTDFLNLWFDVHCTRLRDNLWGDVIEMFV